MATESAFWADHARDMEDPQYALAFLLEQQRVRTVDEIARTLDERVNWCSLLGEYILIRAWKIL